MGSTEGVVHVKIVKWQLIPFYDVAGSITFRVEQPLYIGWEPILKSKNCIKHLICNLRAPMSVIACKKRLMPHQLEVARWTSEMAINLQNTRLIALSCFFCPT